jgi:hypothetical protein
MLAIEPNASARYPEQVTRVPFTRRDEAVTSWEDVVVGQGADVAILDALLHGDDIAEVLSGASVGRLVFARTDWLDGKALLSYLAGTRHGRAVLSDRPFAILGLPTARREGSRVWNTSDDRAAGLSATLLTDEDRDAIIREKS